MNRLKFKIGDVVDKKDLRLTKGRILQTFPENEPVYGQYQISWFGNGLNGWTTTQHGDADLIPTGGSQ